MVQAIEQKKREIEEKFTRYEIARILGARALQIAMNAPVLLKVGKEELQNINFDPLKIAEIEFYAGVLPITVKRPLPRKTEEKLLPREIEPKAKEAKKQKEKEIKKEEKKPQEEVKQKAEEEITKEVEDTEVMEMATPTDEAEEEAPAEEAEGE
jgi:DNA-directed RNA polymerase subunit K